MTAKYGYGAIIVAFMLCDSEAEAYTEEIRLIEEYRSAGIQLVNLSDGGRGGQSGRKLSEEHRRKISASNKGKKKPAGFAEKIRAANLGKKLSPEHIEKMAASKRGKRYSDERRRRWKEMMQDPKVRAKMRAAKLGTRLTSEHRAKIGAAHKGKKHSPEWVEKIRKVHLGCKRSKRVRANIRAGNLRRMQSAEERAKVAAGVRRYFEAHPEAKERSRAKAIRQAQHSAPGHYARMQAASVLAKKAKPIMESILRSWFDLWAMRILY